MRGCARTRRREWPVSSDSVAGEHGDYDTAGPRRGPHTHGTRVAMTVQGMLLAKHSYEAVPPIDACSSVLKQYREAVPRSSIMKRCHEAVPWRSTMAQ
jgi:hypothetical protein